MSMNARIIVTVAADAFGQMDRIAQDLRAAGVDVEQILFALGIITGSVDPKDLAMIRKVRGVGSVENESDGLYLPDKSAP
jgi:hypothetical protein